MTDLYVVRKESVPVEQLREGDRLVQPGGRRVNVERVDTYDEGLVVRWWREAERGEPGFKGRDYHRPLSDAMDGRYLGSTLLVQAGHLFEVDRG